MSDGLPVLTQAEIDALIALAGTRAVSFMTHPKGVFMPVRSTWVNNGQSRALASYWREKCNAWRDTDYRLKHLAADLADLEEQYETAVKKKQKRKQKWTLQEIGWKQADVRGLKALREKLQTTDFRGFAEQFLLEESIAL